MSPVSIQNVFVEATPDRDDDWIAFDCSASEQASEAGGATNRPSCEIKTSDLVQYLAGLDYKMQCGQPNHSLLHNLPPATRQFVKTMLSQGRLLESARIASAGDSSSYALAIVTPRSANIGDPLMVRLSSVIRFPSPILELYRYR